MTGRLVVAFGKLRFLPLSVRGVSNFQSFENELRSTIFFLNFFFLIFLNTPRVQACSLFSNRKYENYQYISVCHFVVSDSLFALSGRLTKNWKNARSYRHGLRNVAGHVKTRSVHTKMFADK